MEEKIKRILELISLNGDKYITKIEPSLFNEYITYNINNIHININTTKEKIITIIIDGVYYNIPELSLVEKATIITNINNQKEYFKNQQIDSIINTLGNNSEDEDI